MRNLYKSRQVAEQLSLIYRQLLAQSLMGETPLPQRQTDPYRPVALAS